jgi:hypothetical protein
LLLDAKMPNAETVSRAIKVAFGGACQLGRQRGGLARSASGGDICHLCRDG